MNSAPSTIGELIEKLLSEQRKAEAEVPTADEIGAAFDTIIEDDDDTELYLSLKGETRAAIEDSLTDEQRKELMCRSTCSMVLSALAQD